MTSLYRVYELVTVALRYFSVFGPRQDPSSQYSGSDIAQKISVIPIYFWRRHTGRYVSWSDMAILDCNGAASNGYFHCSY